MRVDLGGSVVVHGYAVEYGGDRHGRMFITDPNNNGVIKITPEHLDEVVLAAKNLVKFLQKCDQMADEIRALPTEPEGK